MAQFPALPLFTDAYLADTRHLTASQHGAYLLLLMMAWRTSDCSIPNDDAILARWACMDKRTWASNRETILGFWHLGDDQKFRQGRLSDERKYVDHKRNINSANGQASALKRKERDETAVQRNVNETSTPTPTPIIPGITTSNISITKRSITDNNIHTKKNLKKPDDVLETVWDDFIKHRQAKKAPVTETVLTAIRREAEKINWSLDQALSEICARGWQGFKADWVNGHAKIGQNRPSYTDTLEEAARRAHENLSKQPTGGKNDEIFG